MEIKKSIRLFSKAMKRIPAFLILLPFFFILNGYNEYYIFFTFPFTATNFGVLITFIAILYLLIRIFFRDKRAAVVYTFTLTAAILFFGFFHDMLKKITGSIFLASYKFVIPVFILSAILYGINLNRKKTDFERLYFYLNFLFLFLVTFESVNFIQNSHKPADSKLIDSRFNAYDHFAKNHIKINNSLKPDIFFLLFDGMPSSNALKADLGFDNSSLDSFLSRKGFFISSYSKSNYDLTVLSMSSMFNMDYIPEKEIFKGTGIEMYYRSTSSLLDNSFIRILKSENYRTFQYQPLSIFENEDWQGDIIFKHMLTMNYFYRTMPGRIYRDLKWNIFNYDLFAGFERKNYHKTTTNHMADINLLKKNIEMACDTSSDPKFIYGHFILPHPPFIFTRNGEIRPFVRQSNASQIYAKGGNSFLEQIEYADLVIKELTDYILKHNRRNTILIVQGDHGYASKKIAGDFGFQNFTAVYFPDKNYQDLYPSISPVNTFRLVLNKVWKSNFPLLKDSCVKIDFSKTDWEN